MAKVADGAVHDALAVGCASLGARLEDAHTGVLVRVEERADKEHGAALVCGCGVCARQRSCGGVRHQREHTRRLCTEQSSRRRVPVQHIAPDVVHKDVGAPQLWPHVLKAPCKALVEFIHFFPFFSFIVTKKESSSSSTQEQ